MFNFSKDYEIQLGQKKQEEFSLDLIQKYVNIKHSPKIESIFDSECDSISYIVDFVKVIKSKNFRLILPMIKIDETSRTVRYEIEKGFQTTNRDEYDYIPYIKFSFPEMQSINGIFLDHIHILFFNNYSKFDDSEKATLKYLNSFNKMKAFI